MNHNPIEINGDFKYVLDELEKTTKSFFVTGQAGTGKSTLLQIFKSRTKKKVITLAPTGIAALNVKGQTIHSFFGFPPKPISKSDIKPRRYKRLYKKVDIIIIDEISMVRADMMDNIDYFLRINRENPAPFGGVQMLFFGDLFQLPPVIASQEEMLMLQTNYESPYFFSADVFKEDFGFEMVELHKVYRQNQRNFLRLLDAVRLQKMDYDDLETLNERKIPLELAPSGTIILSARNATVAEINRNKLKQLDTPQYAFAATVTGNFSERVFPTDPILQLKEGAQVMFVKNDLKRQYVNGTIGEVIYVDAVTIKVEIPFGVDNYRVIEVEKEEWEILRHKINSKNEVEAEAIGTFKQYPLKLAWAITIHKSQGKTFDNVIIDLGKGAFEFGQTYVALSRCRTLQGIILQQHMRPRDIMTDERVVQYYESNF